MVELEFERRLERLFDEPPRFEDSVAFAARIETRLDRGWAARRMLIGAAGVVGGVVMASQFLFFNIFQRVEAAASEPAAALTGRVAEAAPALSLLSVLEGGAVVWVAGALAIMAAGFFATRVVGEL